ncbi:uncharacterized protein JCM6883_000023 [Sporobolomyces salmoneus]|uniref:uncharacterized protein n=1 Tax=Sporobolomyces salmoneus TaxID=183962 RepID=UPI00317D59C8
MSPPPSSSSTSGPPGGSSGGAQASTAGAEEGEIVEPSISTSTSSTAPTSTRPRFQIAIAAKVNPAFKGAIAKHLEPGKKSNALSFGAAGVKPKTVTSTGNVVSIRGLASKKEGATDGKEAEGTAGKEEEGKNSFEVSIAESSSQPAGPSSTTAETIGGGGEVAAAPKEPEREKHKTPPPVFRRRSGAATRSPRKSNPKVASNPSASAPPVLEINDEDREVAELLKNESMTQQTSPSVQPNLSLGPSTSNSNLYVAPSSTSSLNIPLPLPPRPDYRSPSSPPKNSSMHNGGGGGMMRAFNDHEHDDHHYEEGNSLGLPYDGSYAGGSQSSEQGGGGAQAERWGHDKFREDNRGGNNWGEPRRDYDDRDRRRSNDRDGDRWAPGPSTTNRPDIPPPPHRRRSRSPGYYDSRQRSHHPDPYSNSTDRDRSQRRSSRKSDERREDRYYHRRDEEREPSSRASKRPRRTESPPPQPVDSRREGDRRVSRSPPSEDTDESGEESAPARTVLGEEERREVQKRLKEKERRESKARSTRDERGGRGGEGEESGSGWQRARSNGAHSDVDNTYSPSMSTAHLNLALPPKPNVVRLGESILLSPVQALSTNSNPGSFRSRMAPSTIDQSQSQTSQPYPTSRLQPSTTTTNGNGNYLPPPPLPPAPAPAPARPSYVSAAPDPSERLPPPPPPPPPAPIANGPSNDQRGYPIPPPAPYHPGNRPTDPKDSEETTDSPSVTKALNTPAATTTTTTNGVGSDVIDDSLVKVRTTKGTLDLWLDPPSKPYSFSTTTTNGTELEEHEFFGASHISEYTLQQKLGEGTFGVVYKGIRGKEGAIVTEEEREKENSKWARGLRVRKGDVVALKQIIFHNEGDGLPITSVREIRILKQLDHPNVVPVVDMALDPGDPAKFEVGRTFMVFPYMDHDLAGLLENPQVKLDIGEIKQYGKQLLEGTAYLHRNGILHRDMKAANLLINNKGVLMIADFGLARSMEPPEAGRDYTSCVVTRWYRPPELLLGERKYHYPVDMWGVGCILLEMFKRSPIFPGSSDFHQAQLIFAACGPPTEESMPGWNSLPGVDGKAQQWQNGPRTIRADASHYDTEIFADLLDKILVLDPKRRYTANEALDHDWFWSEPFPTEPSRMRQFMSSHEYDRRKLKENQQAAFGHVVPPPPPPQGPPGFQGMMMPQPGYNLAHSQGYGGPPPGMQPPMPFNPPVGAYNAPPPPPGVSTGMGPSFSNGGGGYNYGLSQHQQQQQSYGPAPGFPPPSGFTANRPPPSMAQHPGQQQQPRYPPQPPREQGLDYGGPNRQSQYPQSQGPSWSNSRGPGPSVAPPVQKVNLKERIMKKK